MLPLTSTHRLRIRTTSGLERVNHYPPRDVAGELATALLRCRTSRRAVAFLTAMAMEFAETVVVVRSPDR